MLAGAGRGVELAITMGAAAILASAAQGQERTLDGLSFEVTMSAVDSTGDSDTYSFARGLFESAAARRWGFARVPYQVERKRGGWAWSAVAQSSRRGEIRWSGIVFRDRTISGSFTWLRRNRDPVTYTFLGRQR